jgi:large subunit ribosomal protein L24
MKLRKGDKVKIMAGKDKGKDGVIDRVYPKQDKILIQGINLIKRHIKKNQELPDGGIIDIPKPVQVSSVMLICPKCEKPTRVGFEVEKGKKTRVCHKCHKPLK